jgi:hypothetical protein
LETSLKVFEVEVNEMQNFVYVNHWTDSVKATSKKGALTILKERYPNKGMHRYSFNLTQV